MPNACCSVTSTTVPPNGPTRPPCWPFAARAIRPFPAALLRAASDTNQHVPDYLVGNKSMPPVPPSYISLGGEDEAISYAAQFLRTWRSSSGAIPWLRKTLKVPLPQPPKPRKPAWSLFRHAFLRLPQVDEEVWQLDVCRLPLSQADGKTYRPPWALVLWNRTEDTILTFRGRRRPAHGGRGLGRADRGPLASPLRRTAPAGGDPGAAQDLLQGLAGKTPADRHPAAGLCDELDGLDRVLENLLPASTSVRRFLEGPETPVAVDLDELASLPQNMGESWQADVRRLPGWLEQGGELRRPWASLVTSRDEHTVLTQNLTMDPPPDEWIWKNVVDAIHRPLMGEPHRPGIVEVGSDAFQRVLYDRLEAIGVRCVVADDLEQIDEIFRQLGKFLSGGKASPPLVEVPGVRLDDIRGFYEAAADFYRAAPWRLVPGDTTLKIECPKFNTHTWYGVVMGQSGLVLGLALV